MDSHSSATLEAPATQDQTPVDGAERTAILAAGFGASLAREFADHVDLSASGECAPAEAIVLFLKPRMSDAERRTLDEFFARARQWRPAFIAVVSSFRVDLGDGAARQIEADAIERAKGCGGRVAVFRTGVIVDDRLARLAPLYPLVPRRMCGCFLDKEELFAAIESERSAKGPFQNYPLPSGRGAGGEGEAPGS